jgi:hypothetical protein
MKNEIVDTPIFEQGFVHFTGRTGAPPAVANA